MSWQTLDLRRDPRGVAYLTLNAPDRRNVLSPAMIADLTEAARSLGADPSVRVVVLSGAGPVFCAGGDLDWMKTQIEADRPQVFACRRIDIDDRHHAAASGRRSGENRVIRLPRVLP